MIDEELQALQRRVREGGGPAERLRYARALLRSGERDEALGVLAPAVDAPEVRRELAAGWPAWGHAGSDAGRSNHVDLLPLRRPPRVLWKTRPPQAATQVLPTPFGIVCGRRRHPPLVLDAGTGAVRWKAPGGRQPDRTEVVPPPAVAGDVLLVPRGSTLVAHDLWTGEELHRIKPGAIQQIVHHAGMLLLEVLGRVIAWRLPDPRRAPEPAWELDLPGRADPRARPPGRIVAGGERAYVWGLPAEMLALSLRDGAIVWRGAGCRPAANAHGVAAQADDGGLAVHDADGEKLFTAPIAAQGLYGLAPGFALAGRRVGRHTIGREVALLVIDRAGETEIARAEVTDWWSAAAIAMARDVIYRTEPGPGVVATRDDGRALWRLDLSDALGDRIVELAAAERRLYGRTSGGVVFCLAEP